MLSSSEIKKAVIEFVNKDDVTDADIGNFAMMMLDVASQLEFMEEHDTISDSQLGLLRLMQTDYKYRALSLEEMLAESLRINDELRKQNKILKDALHK